MKTIGAEKFKKQYLAFLDRLDAEVLIVTKLGKSVAHIVLYDQQYDDLIGSLQYKIKIRGNIFTTGLRCDADNQS